MSACQAPSRLRVKSLQNSLRVPYNVTVTEPSKAASPDKWIQKFLAHLATDRGASVYTQRNYRAALVNFAGWHLEELKQQPAWANLQRDDFRSYLRFLGRHNLGRAAIRLRFSALRS